MSRGLGIAQRAIIEALDGADWTTVQELAEITGRSPRQIISAVRALESRGLVSVTRGRVGESTGDTSRLIARSRTVGRWLSGRGWSSSRREDYPDPERYPTVLTVLPGEQVPPEGDPRRHQCFDPKVNTTDEPWEFIRKPRPVHGLWITLVPDDR